jgi:hypothetical protein
MQPTCYVAGLFLCARVAGSTAAAWGCTEVTQSAPGPTCKVLSNTKVKHIDIYTNLRGFGGGRTGEHIGMGCGCCKVA